MKNDPDPVLRLFEWARIDGTPPTPQPSEKPPVGFVSRILARVEPVTQRNPWEHLAFGSLPIAAALALISLWGAQKSPHPLSPPAEYDRIALTFLQISLEP